MEYSIRGRVILYLDAVDVETANYRYETVRRTEHDRIWEFCDEQMRHRFGEDGKWKRLRQRPRSGGAVVSYFVEEHRAELNYNNQR